MFLAPRRIVNGPILASKRSKPCQEIGIDSRRDLLLQGPIKATPNGTREVLYFRKIIGID